ncbi:hypothetical protein [Flavobacterium sp. AG291]|uniref:hypothetical protein n=1 Tax=Flavobacterium sp. AG291 TaxID=2184000 RepID=UPI0011C057C4|nr:hypothetical protein [Flavobacterium sp. AG291]
MLKIFFFLLFGGASAQYSLGSYNNGQSIFNTYAELMSGMTYVNQVSIPIQYYGTSIGVNEWRLTARLTQDFINDNNPAYAVAAEYAYLQYNSQSNSSSNASPVNVPLQAIALNKYSETTLIHSNVGLNPQLNRLFRYNLYIKGGNHLLACTNGMYKSAYEFRLYKITGQTQQLIGSFTSVMGDARFQINYAGNFGDQSVTLQNGAQQFNISYTTAADYLSERSAVINNALKIKTYNYQLAVQASGDFQSSLSPQILPLSVLKLDISVNQSYNGLQILTPVILSTTAQPIVYRNSSTPQDITFNLKFYIPANSIQAVPAGTYTTSVFFLIIPN